MTITPGLSNRRLAALLRRLGACGEGRDWLGDRDLAAAWNDCERGDWALWFAEQIGVDRRLIVRAAAACAETALRYVPDGEDRPRLAIEAARRWADDPTEANAASARRAASAASYPSYAAYAASAASYAAAYAYAAASSYAAAAASSYAADAYANRNPEARAEALKRCAAIVREHIPFEAVLTAALTRSGGRA